MTEQIRDAAIEAAAMAKHDYLNLITPWDNLSAGMQNLDRRSITPLVDAVLAVVGPAYRAEALRDAADDWPEWAKLTDENDRQSLHGHRQVFQSWLRDRADAEEGA